MSSSCPPQLHLELPPNTTSFKRSFDQFGFDLESPLGPDGLGPSGNDGNDRNKRARSASPFSDDDRSIGSSSSSTLASGSSSMNSDLNNESSLDAHLSPRLSVPHLSLNISRSSLEPPRLPTPVIQDIDMADYPLSGTEEAEEDEDDRAQQHAAGSAESDASQAEGTYRLSLERFNAFDAQIAVLRRSPAPAAARSATPPPVLPPLELLGEDAPISTNNISFLHPPAQPSPPLPHSLYHYGPSRNQRPRSRPNSRNEHPLDIPRHLSLETNTQTISLVESSNASPNADDDSPTYEIWSRTTQASRLARGDDLYRNGTPWSDWPSNAAETGDDDDRDDEVEEEEEVQEVLEQPSALSVWSSPIPTLEELRSPSPLFNHLDELDAQPPPPPLLPPATRRIHENTPPPTLPSIEDQILSPNFDPMRDVLNIVWSNDDSRPPRLVQRLPSRYAHPRTSDDTSRRDEHEPTSPHPYERASTSPNANSASASGVTSVNPPAHPLPSPVSSGWLSPDGPWFTLSSEEEPGQAMMRATLNASTNTTSAASNNVNASASTSTIPAAIDAYVASQHVLNALEGFGNVLRESEVTLGSYLRENNSNSNSSSRSHGGANTTDAERESASPMVTEGSSNSHAQPRSYGYSRASRSPVRRSSTGRTSAWRSTTTSGSVSDADTSGDMDRDREWSRRAQRHPTSSTSTSSLWRLRRYFDEEHDWPMHNESEAPELPVHPSRDDDAVATSATNDEDFRALLARYSSGLRHASSPSPLASPSDSLETLRSRAAALQAAVRDIAQLSSASTSVSDRSSPQPLPASVSWYGHDHAHAAPRRHVDLPTNTSMLFSNPGPPPHPIPTLATDEQPTPPSTDDAPASRWGRPATRAASSERERDRERRERERELQRLRSRLGTPGAPTSTLFSSSTLSNLRPRPYVSQSSTHAQPPSSSSASSSRASPTAENASEALRRAARLRLMHMQRQRMEARTAPPTEPSPAPSWAATLNSRLNPRPRGFETHHRDTRHVSPGDNHQSLSEVLAERRTQLRARMLDRRADADQSPERRQEREPSRSEATSSLYDAALDTLGYPQAHRLPSRGVTRESSPERAYAFPPSPSYRPPRRSADRPVESVLNSPLPNSEGSRPHPHPHRRYASFDEFNRESHGHGRDEPDFLPIPSLPSPGFEFEFTTAASRASSASERSYIPSSSRSGSGPVQPPTTGRRSPSPSPSPAYRRRFDWSPPRRSPAPPAARDFDPDMFASGPFRNTIQSFYASRSRDRDNRETGSPQDSASLHVHVPRYVAPPPPPPSLPPLAFEEEHRHSFSSRSGDAEDFSSLHRNEPNESNVPHLRAFLSRHPLPPTDQSSSSQRMDDLQFDILGRIMAPQGNTTQSASAHPPSDDRSLLAGPGWMFGEEDAPPVRPSVAGPRPPWRASQRPRVPPPPEPRNSDLHNFLMRHPRLEAVRREASRRPFPSPAQGDEDGFNHAIDVLRHDGLSSSRSQEFINQYHRERRDPRSLSTLTSPWGLLEEGEGSTSRQTTSSADQANTESPALPLSAMLPRRRRVPPSDPLFVEYDEDDFDVTSPFGPRPMTRHYRGPGQAPVFPRRVGAFMRLGGTAMRRSGRPLGDYMRDEDFNSDYESLLSLAATIGEVKSRSTPDDVINGLETGLYKDWQTPDSDRRCPICLDDYQPDDTLLKLPECSHWQHRECLQQWLKSASTCPVCRKTVVDPSSSQTRARRGPSGPSSSDAGPSQRREGPPGGGSGRGGGESGDANSFNLGFEPWFPPQWR